MDNEIAVEKFELAARIMGNEVFAFSVSSQSGRKNWVVIGALILVLTSVLANQLIPVIQYMTT